MRVLCGRCGDLQEDCGKSSPTRDDDRTMPQRSVEKRGKDGARATGHPALPQIVKGLEVTYERDGGLRAFPASPCALDAWACVFSRLGERAPQILHFRLP